MLQPTIAPAPSNAMASSASTSYSCYDVFINHRGPDCKHTFATRLYRRLCDQGLQVFLDEQELIEGYNITSQLEAAIRGASVQVAIFSPTYAKSEWCLNELVLMVKSESTVLPVFYGVEPSVLRWTVKGGAYGEALQNLQEKTKRDPHTGKEEPRYDSETIQSWRDALSHVAGISGFVMRGDDEYDLLEKVVQGVVKKVSKKRLYVAKYPTGLDEKLQDFERTVLLKQQKLKTVGARVAGIVGAGGLGKTTLAKHFFNLKRSHYKESVFLSDVRETARRMSLNYLQSRLIQELKHKNIIIENPDQGMCELEEHLSCCHALIILDDVDHIDQMEKLSSMKDSLSPQSLILVTSRDRHILKISGVEDESVYNLEGLNRPDSKELFCCHAFRDRGPPKGFADLVDQFVTACDGLPLSLKVFGATVNGREQPYWKEFLEKLHKRLPTEIENRLRISYESLDEEDRQIFLDIVCFFIGEEIDTAKRICGVVGLENLESKCLLDLDSEKKIKMHDQIRDMGRIIAKEESMPRRLYEIDDLLEQTSSVVTKVRGISMVPRVPHSLLFSSPAHVEDPRWKLFNKYRFDCMNLEFLATEGEYLKAILRRAPFKAILRRAPSVPLRWLRWYNCPYSSFPRWIPMHNLRVIEVAGSRLKNLWKSKSQAPPKLRELNILSPLSHFPNSIGQLNHLEKIFVGYESQILPIKSLPEEFCNLHALKYLTLQGCSKIVSLPESFGKLTNLRRINLNRASSLMTLPKSFGNLTNLEHFELSGASSWETLPNFFGNLENLRHFTLLNASRFQTLPTSFGNLGNLQHFEMSGASSWETFPSFFGNLTNLQHFSLLDASRLEPLPNSFGNLTNLQHFELSGASSWETLPNYFEKLTNLQHFEFSGDFSLTPLKFSGNLTNIGISLLGLSSLKTLPSGNLANVSINISGASSLETLPRRNCFEDLTDVSISTKLSCASSLESPPLPNFFKYLENVKVTADFQNVNHSYMMFDENLTNVFISMKLSGALSLETLPVPIFLGNLVDVSIEVDFQNVDINLAGASNLERVGFLGDLTNVNTNLTSASMLSRSRFDGNLTNVFISIKLSDASSLESLPFPDFFGNLRDVTVKVDFQNVNTNLASASMLSRPRFDGNLTNVFISIKLSGASMLSRPRFDGNLTNVFISIKLSGASSLETLLFPDFFGNLRDVTVELEVDFQNVNTNLASASMLSRPRFHGNLTNVSISIKFSDASSLETLPFPDSLGNLREVPVEVDFHNVSINLDGASSLETLLLPQFDGWLTNVKLDFQNVNINLAGASTLE